MVVWRFAVMAVSILALASGSMLSAQEKDKQAGKLEELARKLNLTDQQKQQVKLIFDDFDTKADPLIRQLCTQRGEEWQALQNALNEGQKAKLKEVLEAQNAKELKSIAQKLNLSEEQQKQVEKIRNNFWNKFLSMSIQKGPNMGHQYREIHLEAVGAGRKVLTLEQCTKLHVLQTQDVDEWHDHIFRGDHLKELGEKIGLSAEQIKKLQQECDGHEKKLVKPCAQFKSLCKEECAAMKKVLTAEQQAKFHELFPFDFLDRE